MMSTFLPVANPDDSEDTDRQNNETIKALLEMNELWSSKLGDLITQFDDLVEEEYKLRLKKPSREDQATIKALIGSNQQFQIATLE